MEQLTHIEESIKALWEKAKQAGELILRLREEKQALQTQIESLHQEVAKLRMELTAKDQQVQKLITAQASNETKSTANISNGEREQLTAKVKELLARIDAYL